MYTTDSAPEACFLLWKDCAEQTQIFLQDAPVKTVDKVINAKQIIQLDNTEFIYHIKQGTLKESYHNNIIINYEDGDLVGVGALFQKKRTELSTDFAVIVDEYNPLQLLDHIRTDRSRNKAWVHFLSSLIQSYQILLAHHKQQHSTFNPEIRNYEAGDTIIKEGEKGDEVFTLISGNAQALVGSTVVGEVNCDEVFGAIAALTDTARTASIKAESPCTVLVVPSPHFRDLLASRPDTVTKLFHDMARTIISSNEKIIKLSK